MARIDDAVSAPDGRGVDARVVALADRQDGVVAKGQLRALGMSEKAVRTRVERDWLVVLHRGVYAVGRRRLTHHAGRWPLTWPPDHGRRSAITVQQRC